MPQDTGTAVLGRAEYFFNSRGRLRLAFAVGAAALGLDALHREDWRLAVDFHTYFAAAVIGVQDGWSHLYDQHAVALTQKELVPDLWAQPFLSPPTVAWLAAPLTALPFWAAFMVWGVIVFTALAAALAWSSVSGGWMRWIAVIGALSPFWVLHSIRVGQVVPLVAAAVLVAWRLLREKHDVAAGLVLVAILLKPNTAFLVPVALLIVGRRRAFVAWSGASLAVLLVIAVTLGSGGLSAYVGQLMGPLPRGADSLTLYGAMGVTGGLAAALRLLIVGGALATVYRLRSSTDLVLPVAILGSLLVAPYLHAADLCLLSVAGFILWEMRPTFAWRAPLVAGWVLASPFFYETGLTPHLNRWPWLELALLLALVLAAWRPLTAWADSRRRAPA